MLNQVGRGDYIGILEVYLVKRKRIGNKSDFIVADLTSQVTVTAKQRNLPGFVAIGDRVGAAHVEVAVLLHQVDDNVDAFTSRVGAFCNDATDAVTDAAVVDFLILFNRDVAIVGDNHNTLFIDEAVRETRAFRSQRLRPPEAKRVLDLRDLGGRRFELDHFTRLVIGGWNPVLICNNAAIVVFVVPNENFPGCRRIFADNNRKAGLRRKTDRSDGRTN